MRMFIAMLGLLTIASSSWCQDVPKAEVFAGYSYLNIDTNDLSSRQSAHGWDASVSGNFNKWLAAEFDFSGHYKTYGFVIPGAGTIDVKVRDYSYLAGPRINFRPLFVHALFGGDHLTGSTLGISNSQDSFAGLVGGGVQQPITRLLSIRVSADYVLSRHNIFGGPSVTQNNFRASAGIVFNFGGSRREKAKASVPETTRPSESRAPLAPIMQPTADAVALSLGVTGHPTGEGFMITSVRERSPAAQIFLRPGDILTKVGDKEVKTGEDIDSAVAASMSGATVVTGLTKIANGWVVFEREVKVR